MQKRYVKKLISSLIFSGAGIFTLLFFSPLEVYLGNPTDFRIPIGAGILILGLASAAVTLVFSVLISFLPVKTLKVVNLCILGTTLCFYIQSLFLNGELIRLNGEKLELSITTKLVNLGVWAIIFLVVIGAWLLCKKIKKEKLFITATKWLALALVLMQVAGVASLLANYDTSENENKELYFSTEGRLELSEKNNVVYFIIDYCDDSIVKEALGDDPALFDGLDGFTYYPDNLYIHGRSYPAITYLLTGQKCRYDKTVTEYINDSFRDNTFIQALEQSDADIRYYTDPRYVGAQAKQHVNNYKSANAADGAEVRPFAYIKQTLRVSGFRGLPYIVKEKFAYDTEVVNDKSLIRTDDFAPILDDLEFYQAITDRGVSVNAEYSAAYRFYHMFGSHPGATVNEQAEYETDVTLSEALRGDMKIIKAYLEQLKELGIYDNTTVIITADHGHYMGQLKMPQTCLMLVKEAGADSDKPMQTSTAQVSHENLFATVLETLGKNTETFAPAISKVDENDRPVRYTYQTELGGDGAESVVQEYEVIGNAADLNNYHKTANQWDVLYSIYH